jgi:hypothetical protein
MMLEGGLVVAAVELVAAAAKLVQTAGRQRQQMGH